METPNCGYPIFMKSILIAIACLTLFGSIHSIKPSMSMANIAIDMEGLAPLPDRSYLKTISKVDSLKQVAQTKNLETAGILFADFINKELVPYWIGTPWDFNGITQTPGKGEIACGYFVTTVLRDAGVKINRVKMAQCASETMINSMTKKKVNYSGIPFNDFIKKVKAKGKGIAIIGLDYHTGFLYNDGEELWFIHSSFVHRKGVVKEQAVGHPILTSSKYKVVGFVSQDTAFIRNWLNQ